MNNQYPAVTPAKKSTYLDLGAKAGSLGFAGANIAYRLLGKGDLRFATPGGFLQSTAASAALGGLLGAIGGAHVTKNASATNVLAVKETEDIMNTELMRACEMAKIAADMSLPLEKKPAPEAGSQPVQGMTDNSTFSPTSVGASTYAGAVDAAALAKARAAAAMAMSKQAAAEEAYYALLEKLAADDFVVVNGKLERLSEPGTTNLPSGKTSIDRVMKRDAEYRKQVGNKPKYGPAPTPKVGELSSKKEIAESLRRYKKDNKGPKKVSQGTNAVRSYADGTQRPIMTGKSIGGRGTLNNPLLRDRAAGVGKNIGKWMGKNRNALIAGATLGTLGLAGGYAAGNEKVAYVDAYEDYLDKLASIEEYGVTPDEAYMAAEAAVELYNDCLEKMAYAEDLFTDADNYFLALEEAEEFEKQAAEYVPIASSTLGALAGATAGYVAGAKFPAMRNGVAMAGMAAGGAGVGSALGQFAATMR